MARPLVSSDDKETSPLLQVAFRREVERIGLDPWVTVYSNFRNNDRNYGHFCALVKKSKLGAVMRHDSWDLSICDGRPGFSQTDGKSARFKYCRFGTEEGLEPLVFVRSFHGLKPDCVELREEFRHFLDLYHDNNTGRYLRFSEGGEEETVAEVHTDCVRIRTLPLRQFLAARKLHLAVFFDSVAFTSIDARGRVADNYAENVVRTDLRYSLYVRDDLATGRRTSCLLGKRLIAPLPIENSGVWPYERSARTYVEFILGVNSAGKEISHTCDPSRLADYYGKNPGAPHFLTPVVFRREVLKKYFDHHQKYQVEDGFIRCGSLWGLRLDNNTEDRVMVFLGDLGTSLDHSEQLYWRSFNIPPICDGKDISNTNARRSFDAEFAEPSAPDLAFKSKLLDFQLKWEQKFGWQLIRKLRDEDSHVLARLRVPVADSMEEFEDQLLGLTKLLVDSLNDRELQRELGGALPNEKSIAKFERFLASKGYPEVRRDLEFLRLLQEGRSTGAAHRKGSSFAIAAGKLGLAEQSRAKAFAHLLRRGTEMFDGLEAFFELDAAQ